MKRDLLEQLKIWQKNPLRKPLLLRGARQVGKSWLVRDFGKTFQYFIEINFEKQSSAKELFAGDINIPVILERLAIFAKNKIVPGETLLFLDEIQECESALIALRYFKEEYPELHVIAAGSLLDFSLEKIGMPVGRVQFLYLYPLSFGEFLVASGRQDLRHSIRAKEIDSLLYDELQTLLKTYLWLGGMPAVLTCWIDHKNPREAQETQDEIIQAYRDDFEKYARKNQIPYVEKLFESIPVQVGKKFKYINVDKKTPSQPLKNAVNFLEKAGIIYRCYHTSGQHIPLGADKDLQKFKLFFFDVGLANRILGLDISEWVLQSNDLAFRGNMTENFVAQEMIGYTFTKKKAELYYWHREAKSSNAEVDFLIVRDRQIIPIEVKAGVKGGMKSLRMFLITHEQSTYGIKISASPFARHEDLLEVPLYGLEWLFSY